MTTAPVHRTVAGQGVRLAVAERGLEHETTIVMIHGWPDTKALWNPIADHLAADYHVVTYDVRGAGESGHPTERDAYRIEVLVEDLAAIIDATSTGPVHLVGHDWGAVQGWEAAGIDFGGRLASFTSISGPSLDHSGYAIRAQLRGGPRALVALADQVMRFGYILTFATPVPRRIRRSGPTSRINRSARRFLARALQLVEHHPPDPDHPAPAVAWDAAHGTQMYLANILRRLRYPNERATDVPVQIIEATRDPVVRKLSIDASEPWVANLRRRHLPGGHWMVRSHPTEIAAWIAEFVKFTSGGHQSTELCDTRVDGHLPRRA